MQNVLEQGTDFWCWFDKTQFSFHCVQAIICMKRCLQSNCYYHYTFQSNCAEGLHFSAFYYNINYTTGRDIRKRIRKSTRKKEATIIIPVQQLRGETGEEEEESEVRRGEGEKEEEEGGQPMRGRREKEEGGTGRGEEEGEGGEEG